MKYTKPTLRSIDSESELYCGNGSGAASSGCTVGNEIGTFCSFGLWNSFCNNGNSASAICILGMSPASSASNRCYTGTGPS